MFLYGIFPTPFQIGGGSESRKKVLNVYQELTYYNQSNDTLSSIILNDWNNAYSDKNTALGARFSDEYVRSFHLASEKERGNTNTITIIDDSKSLLSWSRPEGFSDLVEFELKTNYFRDKKRHLHYRILLKFRMINLQNTVTIRKVVLH